MKQSNGDRVRSRPGLRPLRLLLALAVAVVGTGFVALGPATPAAAASCYAFSGTLREGSTGEAVRQLQLRVAGWVARDEVLTVDGNFGPRTKAAVAEFQKAYGLGSDGVAGPQTFAKLGSLEDGDCTPIHFTFAELDKCGSNYTGSDRVSQAEAKRRTVQVMWQLEAMRKKLGDQPLKVTSGFRNNECNSQAHGDPNSPHLYGVAADLGSGPRSYCDIYRAARTSGFSGLLGPGYPGHDDHVHTDNRHVYGKAPFRSAPSCS